MGGSYRSSSDNRILKDSYPTAWPLVMQLLEKESFKEPFLEPCTGKYQSIERYLQSLGKDVIGYNLFFGEKESRRDFLVETRKFPSIVTNPPFRLAAEFIETAFHVADKFAFLMPLDYLHSQDRYQRFYRRDMRPRRIYTLTRRPLFDGLLRDDGCYNTGSTTFAWFIFEGSYSGRPELDWIDNSRFVYRKRAL